MNISGNTIFIPGATSGIGRALAVALSQRGNTVVVGGRRTELLEQIAGEHPGIGTVQIDTADHASIREASARVLQQYPELNVVIAMAGIMQVEDWHRPEGFLDSAERIVTTNLLGPIRLVAEFVEHLQSRPEASIVTVSSGLAFVPLAATPSYNASKAAIHMLSEGIRIQLADTSVKVLEIEPPAVATDLMPGQKESPIAMPLEDFVAEVMDLIEADPEAHEIQVERVKGLRFAEVNGNYDQVVAQLNGSDPHGK